MAESPHTESKSGTVRREIYKKLSRILACPSCRTPLDLRADTEALFCPSCGAKYPVVNGVPIMLKDYTGPSRTFAWDRPESLMALKRLPVFGSLLRRLLTPPGGILNFAAPANYQKLRALLSSVAHPQLLYVGGAHGLGYGSENLGDDLLQSVVNTDISLLPGVDLVADTHHLPFVNESFDCVVIQAVLQYTEEPQAVIGETLRVLRAGGYVYSEVPFLQHYDPGHDYQRFTSEGLAYLFRDFEPVNSGLSSGPASTLSHITPYFLAALFSFRSEGLYKLLLTALRWIFFPLRYLDWVVKDHGHAREIASGFYFLGRNKKEHRA